MVASCLSVSHLNRLINCFACKSLDRLFLYWDRSSFYYNPFIKMW